MSRKGAKSRRRITSLRSKTTKASTRVSRSREPRAELEKKLEARTRELSEAREQQAAISDILRVISNSPSDVQPVLHSVAEHTARICEAQIVDIIIVENNEMHVDASFGELARPVSMPSRGSQRLPRHDWAPLVVVVTGNFLYEHHDPAPQGGIINSHERSDQP